ncbi:RND transporter [Saccharopolyspora sp. SCSIO 74807]|uniref:RND transporter n=1 Tax=Saccharopolyspora sp. SCSIO 74807 TaxID=3118084 RepID=UPI0030D11968
MLTAIAAGLVAVFAATGLAQVSIQTSVTSFLPTQDPAVSTMDKKAGSFGGDPIVVHLRSQHPGELLGPGHLNKLVRLEGELSGLPDVSSVYGPGTTLNQLAGRAQDFLAELTGRRDAERAKAMAVARDSGADRQEAAAEGERAVAEFDRRYGPLLVQGMPAGLPTLQNPNFVNSVIFAENGVRPQWQFIVPSPDSAAVLVRPREGMDADATQRLVDNVHRAVSQVDVGARETTVSGVPVLASALSSQVAREVPLIGGLAVLAVGACFLLVPWTRWRRRLLPVITTLIAIALTLAVFGWAGRPLSLGVVAFLSVLLGVGSYYPTYFAQHARSRVVLVVAGGSAASFATLLLSPLPFVRDLGMTLAVGVFFSAGVGMLLVRRFFPDSGARDSGAGTGKSPPRSGARPARSWVVTGVASVCVAGVGWTALPSMPLEANIEHFAAGLPAYQDARQVEQDVGSSGEVDVVLRGPDVTSPEAMEWMQRTQALIVTEHGDSMQPVLSLPALLSFLGQGASGEQIASGMRMLPPYLAGAVARDDHRGAVMIYGVRMDDLGELKALRDDVQRLLPPPPSGYQAELTGLPVVAVRGQELVSEGRVVGNVLGILGAGAVLALGLRRRSDALRAVVAGAMATGIGFFGLWALDIALSPITVALGSLTAAVGCEFTVLLADSVRTGNRGLRRSIALATSTSAVGYAVLAFSDLAAIREFGLLLAAAVLISLGSAACVVWLTTGRERPQQPVDGDMQRHVPDLARTAQGVD